MGTTVSPWRYDAAVALRFADFAGWSGDPSIAALSVNPRIDAMCHEETFASASPHSTLRSCLGLRTREIAISASVDAAPAAVKAAQSLPVVLVSRLTINVARKSLRTETDTSEKCQRRIFSENAEHVRCGYDKMELRVEQSPYKGAALAGTIDLGDLTVNRLGFAYIEGFYSRTRRHSAIG
jgi:hypothetical protein